MLADVAASYDRGVDGYVGIWSKVIQPPAEAVVAALDLAPTATIVDVGGGSGALVPALRTRASNGTVICIDASMEMLRAASARTRVPVTLADALALPLRNKCADAVLMAYVLFHLAQPHTALLEVARALRDGGRVGTVTWASEASMAAFRVWDRTLTEAGAAPLPPRRVDTGLDSPEAVASTLTDAGLTPRKVWTESLAHQWTADTYWELAAGAGVNRLRLDALDEPARATTLARARERLEALDPADLAWHGEVVCAIATR